MDDVLYGTAPDGSTFFHAKKVYTYDSVNGSTYYWLSAGKHHSGLIHHNELRSVLEYWLCVSDQRIDSGYRMERLCRVDGNLGNRAVCVDVDSVVPRDKTTLLLEALSRGN